MDDLEFLLDTFEKEYFENYNQGLIDELNDEDVRNKIIKHVLGQDGLNKLIKFSTYKEHHCSACKAVFVNKSEDDDEVMAYFLSGQSNEWSLQEEMNSLPVLKDNNLYKCKMCNAKSSVTYIPKMSRLPTYFIITNHSLGSIYTSKLLSDLLHILFQHFWSFFWIFIARLKQ